MSTEEDTELRDLVAHTLESTGALGNIRAQLRANVFLALEDQGSNDKKSFVNDKLEKFVSTRSGRIITCLIYEFLEYFNLDFTLAVFEPESNSRDIYNGRRQISNELNIKDNNMSMKQPLLVHLLENKLEELSSNYYQSERLINKDFDNNIFAADKFYNEELKNNILNSNFTDDRGDEGKHVEKLISGASISKLQMGMSINHDITNDVYYSDGGNNFVDNEFHDFSEKSKVNHFDGREKIPSKSEVLMDEVSEEVEISDYSDLLKSNDNNSNDLTTDCNISYSEANNITNCTEDIDPT